MRLLKSRDFRTRLFVGANLAATRMHSTMRQMFHGWGRIYSGTARRSPRRIVGAMIFLIVSGLSVYPALTWGGVVLDRSFRCAVDDRRAGAPRCDERLPGDGASHERQPRPRRAALPDQRIDSPGDLCIRACARVAPGGSCGATPIFKLPLRFAGMMFHLRCTSGCIDTRRESGLPESTGSALPRENRTTAVVDTPSMVATFEGFPPSACRRSNTSPAVGA